MPIAAASVTSMAIVSRLRRTSSTARAAMVAVWWICVPTCSAEADRPLDAPEAAATLRAALAAAVITRPDRSRVRSAVADMSWAVAFRSADATARVPTSPLTVASNDRPSSASARFLSASRRPFISSPSRSSVFCRIMPRRNTSKARARAPNSSVRAAPATATRSLPAASSPMARVMAPIRPVR